MFWAMFTLRISPEIEGLKSVVPEEQKSGIIKNAVSFSSLNRW